MKWNFKNDFIHMLVLIIFTLFIIFITAIMYINVPALAIGFIGGMIFIIGVILENYLIKIKGSLK